MTQVIIFQGGYAKDIAKLVNEWLADPRNPEPKDIQYQYSGGYAGVMITYWVQQK